MAQPNPANLSVSLVVRTSQRRFVSDATCEGPFDDATASPTCATLTGRELAGHILSAPGPPTLEGGHSPERRTETSPDCLNPRSNLSTSRPISSQDASY